MHHSAPIPQRWQFLSLILLICATIGGSTIQHPSVSAASELAYQVFIPAAIVTTPSTFGLNIANLGSTEIAESAATLGTRWVRGNNNLLWKDIEPTEGGAYNWNAPSVKLMEQELLQASHYNLTMILVVRASPRWATFPYKTDCGPINPLKYARFAAFMAAAVERYSKAPYNVEYWEIGNEPDGPLFPTDSIYGCWGMTNDPYYGGQAYGNMLKVVYPAMKAKARHISVLNGGLLLDAPYNPSTDHSRMARFLEGIFLAGAADSFDILSFHSYSYYNGTPDGTRGSTDWKVAYLRKIMQTYHISRKPMIDTEAALLCTAPSSTCRETQADALARYYVRSINDGLLGHMWYIYDNDSFNNTALIEPSNFNIPRPAYFAYKHAAELLGNARLLNVLSGQQVGVEGYRFAGTYGLVTVVWSNTGLQAIIPVDPTALVSCTNRDGATIDCTNVAGQVTITTQNGPIYVSEQ